MCDIPTVLGFSRGDQLRHGNRVRLVHPNCACRLSARVQISLFAGRFAAGLHLGIYLGVRDLRLRRRGWRWQDLPPGGLQPILRIGLAQCVQGLRDAHDSGERAFGVLYGIGPLLTNLNSDVTHNILFLEKRTKGCT